MNTDFYEFYKAEVSNLLPDTSFREVYEYILFPPGKLYRPLLFQALCYDLGLEFNQAQKHLACAIELHHSYTLVHDDLPCMDNDDMRRGRASTHVKFNEWKALLAGDGLLNLSYEFLAKLPPIESHRSLKLFSKYLGARGLVQGQAYDLDENCDLKSHFNLIIHELKTARMIQVVTMAPSYIFKNSSLAEVKDFSQFGLDLGIIFQLLDDLSEFTEAQKKLELDKNLFALFPHEAFEHLKGLLERTQLFIDENKLNQTLKMVEQHYQKISVLVHKNKVEFKRNLNQDLVVPIFSLLNDINKSQSAS